MNEGTYRDELAEIQTFILLAEAEELIRQGEAELRAYRDQEAARAFIDAAEAREWIAERENECRADSGTMKDGRIWHKSKDGKIRGSSSPA